MYFSFGRFRKTKKVKKHVEDSGFLLEENGILAINTWAMVGGMVLIIVAAVISAFVFSDTHDIKKSIILYLPISAVIAIVITILGVPLIISFGIIGFGMVVLIYASNHFFYK